MDTLFTGNIPKNYKYIYLKDNYIYLFSIPQANNEIVDCYKIDNKGQFLYCKDTFQAEGLINFEKVNVTNKHYYRTDYTNVLICSLIIAFALVFILNIITSFVKRGGLLSGLF